MCTYKQQEVTVLSWQLTSLLRHSAGKIGILNYITSVADPAGSLTVFAFHYIIGKNVAVGLQSAKAEIQIIASRITVVRSAAH